MALVALVAVVLALAAGLTSGGVGGQVLAGLQHGLCEVARVACTRPRPADADLPPCPLERTSRGEALTGAFELVQLGGGATLSSERLSDGHVRVTLAGDATVNGELGLGFSLSLGHQHAAGASLAVQQRFVRGRSWTLPDAAAARDFVARYGGKATVVGKAVDVVRSGCSVLCDAIGWKPHAALPPADELSIDSGLSGRLDGSPGLAHIDTSGGRLLGARLLRDGGSTWYLGLDEAVGAALLSTAGLGVGAQRQSAVSFTLDARQRLSALTIKTVSANAAVGTFAAADGRASASADGTIARVAEVEATLDLRSAGDRAAARAFAQALRHPRAVAQLQRRAAAVGRRIEHAGVLDRRTYALTSSAFALGGAAHLGGRLGGGFERMDERMRLLSAETRLPGLPFLPRDDCRRS